MYSVKKNIDPGGWIPIEMHKILEEKRKYDSLEKKVIN